MTLYEVFRIAYMKARVVNVLLLNAQGIQHIEDVGLWETMIVGFFSSGISSFITTPMDVVKTRMMLSASEKNQKKLSFLQTFKKVYRVGIVTRGDGQEEGFKALFSGAITRVVLVSTAGAVYFGAFEAYRKRMREVWLEQCRILLFCLFEIWLANPNSWVIKMGSIDRVCGN